MNHRVCAAVNGEARKERKDASKEESGAAHLPLEGPAVS